MRHLLPRSAVSRESLFVEASAADVALLGTVTEFIVVKAETRVIVPRVAVPRVVVPRVAVSRRRFRLRWGGGGGGPAAFLGRIAVVALVAAISLIGESAINRIDVVRFIWMCNCGVA